MWGQPLQLRKLISVVCCQELLMCQPRFVLILTKFAAEDQTSGILCPVALHLRFLSGYWTFSGTEIISFRISKCDDDQTRQPDYEEYDIFADPSPQVPVDEFSQCGRNASGSVLTITGDDGSAGAPETESQPGEFPHMCVIFQQKEGFKDYIGGAALIARNKVITVAHKFYHE